MNIAQIRAAAEKLADGAQAALERIEGKENQTERDETRLAALENFISEIEDALSNLNDEWEG